MVLVVSGSVLPYQSYALVHLGFPFHFCHPWLPFSFLYPCVFPCPCSDLLLSGYVRGKAMAEEALQTHYPEGGVALRPGVVYGNR